MVFHTLVRFPATLAARFYERKYCSVCSQLWLRRKLSEQLLAGFRFNFDRHSWSPEDDSYWPPAFFSCATMRLTFVVKSKTSQQLSDGLPWHLVQTLVQMSTSSTGGIAILLVMTKHLQSKLYSRQPQLCFVFRANLQRLAYKKVRLWALQVHVLNISI